ncbi:cell division protein CrgA [Nocardioides sp. SR21]|uniref:cell division protein CrgA n=1 Tax=Nocardioides sp. SR21 TaxID=2919501 RepID=UPI001FA99C2B|nr:cell division protein CrgA [Nocardioides sp. SR21]
MAKANLDPLAPVRGPIFTKRFIAALVAMVLGIAWMAYYYVAVRVDPTAFPVPEAGSPKFMADLGNWNYLIGFGLIFLGLMVSAHPSTPLGRGRGVVVGMLGCFLVGLIWICTYYIFSDDISSIPVFNDLGQKNLFVGIGFMAIGFTFATRWE